MAIIDLLPNAEGIIYPEKANPTVPEGATCQETLGMFEDRYVRCGAQATCVIAHREREIYYMCQYCGQHNVRNRGGVLLAGGIEGKLRPC